MGDALFDLDLANPIDLSQPIVFDEPGDGGPGDGEPHGASEQPFGAPAPRRAPLRTPGFLGDVVHGGSCNCFTLSLTPHTSGTHTEGVGHLTRERLDAWRLVPAELLPCLLLDVVPGASGAISGAALEARWPRDSTDFVPRGALLRNGRARARIDLENPPFFTPDAMRWLVARGIEHLVVELPSLDPRDDGGRLAAHRVFFGLAPDSTALHAAQRPRATVTELASIPESIAPGRYLLQLQVPAIAGDAVPSRPLLYTFTDAAG
jgi:hypothetical protein